MLLVPVIEAWLKDATQQLTKSGIGSSRLDSEIILAHTLRVTRTYLHAHGDQTIEPRQQEIADARLSLRLDRVPIAYIIGHKDFYGRRFNLTSATLVPRPESETMIDLLKADFADASKNSPSQRTIRLVDVGTGSGCLGITAALELPGLDVSLVDINRHCLAVASKNAHRLNADVHIIQSDLLASYPFTADVILANLPYVDPSWDVSLELQHEPSTALFAGDGGLELIKKLLRQAKVQLAISGCLYLEADLRQHARIIDYATSLGFSLHGQQGFIIVLRR